MTEGRLEKAAEILSYSNPIIPNPVLNSRLRIWGSGVRIPPSAPSYSDSTGIREGSLRRLVLPTVPSPTGLQRDPDLVVTACRLQGRREAARASRRSLWRRGMSGDVACGKACAAGERGRAWWRCLDVLVIRGSHTDIHIKAVSGIPPALIVSGQMTAASGECEVSQGHRSGMGFASTPSLVFRGFVGSGR
jgi:hypothetical protein